MVAPHDEVGPEVDEFFFGRWKVERGSFRCTLEHDTVGYVATIVSEVPVLVTSQLVCSLLPRLQRR